MPFFKRVFKNKEGTSKGKKGLEEGNGLPAEPVRPRWEESWTRKEVRPEEVQELIHVCTQEMKSRALDNPFLLLPFRPGVDQSAAKIFVRSFFKSQYERDGRYSGEYLKRELRLTDPMVLCSIMKWCWSRLPGGVVTWEVYETFRVGEIDSGMARHAFDTFIPLGVDDSDARKQIIFDFYDLLAAIAARGKSNGLGGRKLSRLSGWWAFEFTDVGTGFDGGYKSWAQAADASSHLFYAYLRSLSPEMKNGVSGISQLPRSLQALVSQTEYPPETPLLMQTRTTKVVMIVGGVSPSPFALLRRARNFEYRDDDLALQQFSSYEDPVQSLTDECRRVLRAISSTNEMTIHTDGLKTTQPDASWSQFENMGFTSFGSPTSTTNGYPASISGDGTPAFGQSRSRVDNLGRPATPSWADFLSSGFAEGSSPNSPAPLLLPPDKQLPPVRVQSSQSHVQNGLQGFEQMEAGELASITTFDLDETFWWVWMASLATEEPAERKAVFGRCALVETNISGGRWLVVEEQVKGAAAPEEGAYIAEKKSKFSWTRRGRLGGKKPSSKKVPTAPVPEPYDRSTAVSAMSKRSLNPDQHARVQAAAAALKERDNAQDPETARRGRQDEQSTAKTTSVLTLQSHIVTEAAPAMKWAKSYDKGTLDKEAMREQYLADKSAGTGGNYGASTSQINLPPSMSQTSLATPYGPKPPPKSDTPIREHPTSPMNGSGFFSPMPLESPLPPPLPVVPKGPTKNEVAAFAAEVPLPSPAIIGDEKLPVQTPQTEKHPALRGHSQVPARKPLSPTNANASAEGAVEAARKAWEAKTTEPEEEKAHPKKLKKGTAGTGGGFKGFFGGKKSAPQSAKNEASLQPPAPKLGRNLSVLRKKSASNPPTPEAAAAEVKQSTEIFAAAPAAPVLREEAQAKADAPRPYSPVGSKEQREADSAFSRFDQGPIDDMPAFIPADTPERGPSPVPVPVVEPVKPQQAPVPIEVDDEISEVEEPAPVEEQPVTMQDRWAQIRAAAAQRAALQQRSSEEQGSFISQSQSAKTDKTDDGDTSGEETIEARVARIKARVAELTGNDTVGPVTRVPARGMR